MSFLSFLPLFLMGNDFNEKKILHFDDRSVLIYEFWLFDQFIKLYTFYEIKCHMTNLTNSLASHVFIEFL
jgi:hypothetical protein